MFSRLVSSEVLHCHNKRVLMQAIQSPTSQTLKAKQSALLLESKLKLINLLPESSHIPKADL